MSILIGLKKQSAGGTFNGVDGLEGFSMEGTSFNIIREGSTGGFRILGRITERY